MKSGSTKIRIMRITHEEVVLFALADKPNRFQMVTSCRMRNDSSEAKNTDGSINRNGDGKLKLTRIWPFSTKILDFRGRASV